MGMSLIGHDVTWPSAAALDGLVIERTGLDELFARSDVVSLHCPLTEQTYHLVDEARLARMKPTSLLINTSRGPLVDGDALASGLRSGRSEVPVSTFSR